VLGDLKLDPAFARPGLATDLVRATGALPIFIAGSTHEGEESAALEALAACARHGLETALVIAPRHLDRVSEITSLVGATGRRLHLRSQLAGARLANGDVLLLDSIGELAALYATASVVFVGGTLVPLGGHNLLEPLFEGAPVVFGPHVEKARDAARLALESRAGTQVADSAALAQAIVDHIAAAKESRTRGELGRRFLESHRGSTRRSADWLCEAMEHGSA